MSEKKNGHTKTNRGNNWTAYDNGFSDGFMAGRREQARVDQEELKKRLIPLNMNDEHDFWVSVEINNDINALSAVAPEEMEYIAPCSKCGQPHIAPTADCHYDNRRAKEDEHDAE